MKLTPRLAARFAMGIVVAAVLAGCSALHHADNPMQSVKYSDTAAAAPAPPPLPSRTFTVSYTARVAEAPQGSGQLDVWLPVPPSDAQQTIADLEVQTDLPYEFQTEGEYGNRVLHVWSNPSGATSITLVFHCKRRAARALPSEQQANVSTGPQPTPRLLQPDRLGVIDDRIRALAEQITRGQPDTLTKARAIYDYVVAHMQYDKSEPGWGNGDTVRACDVHKGNCTDFNALFISLARASSIPARFDMGLWVPSAAKAKVEGYHCWVEFWLPGTGWVPVDPSEAQKHPRLRDFYFGNLDDNRVKLSTGRDVRLPGAHGEPLNYWLGPYAEADGKPVSAERMVTIVSEANDHIQ